MPEPTVGSIVDDEPDHRGGTSAGRSHKSHPPSFALHSALSAVWILTGLWVAGWFLMFFLGIRHAQTAVQESSVSAMCCTGIVTGYVLARCVDSACRGLFDAR